MWVFLNDSYLSIVQKPGDTDVLTVRARIKGDIEAVFPEADVNEGTGTDYLYRAKIDRERVARVMFDRVMELTAPNFKASVRDEKRHSAYMDVWDVMFRYQENGAR